MKHDCSRTNNPDGPRVHRLLRLTVPPKDPAQACSDRAHTFWTRSIFNQLLIDAAPVKDRSYCTVRVQTNKSNDTERLVVFNTSYTLKDQSSTSYSFTGRPVIHIERSVFFYKTGHTQSILVFHSIQTTGLSLCSTSHTLV